MNNKSLTTQKIIENKIFLIRGKRVMFDSELAVLYGVETKVFNQSLKITGSIQHATAAVECILHNITGDHNATLGQILKKRKDIIPSPLNISVEKAWGYASDKARHVREGSVLDHSEAEFFVTQFYRWLIF